MLFDNVPVAVRNEFHTTKQVAIEDSPGILTLVRRGGKSSLAVFRKSRLVRGLVFESDENAGAWSDREADRWVPVANRNRGALILEEIARDEARQKWT